MTHKIVKLIGTLAFYVTLPALFFYLQKNERSRVIVVHDGKILVLKSWYGPDMWILPGGGIHDDEQPAVGAARELREETGIQVEPGKLEFIRRAPVADSHGLRHTQQLFTITLDQSPDLVSIPNREIMSHTWMSPEEIAHPKSRVVRSVRAALKAWSVS